MRIEKIVSKALEHTDNDRYLLTAAISKRVKQLQNGAEALVPADIKNEELADVALREIAEGLIDIEKD